MLQSGIPYSEFEKSEKNALHKKRYYVMPSFRNNVKVARVYKRVIYFAEHDKALINLQ